MQGHVKNGRFDARVPLLFTVGAQVEQPCLHVAVRRWRGLRRSAPVWGSASRFGDYLWLKAMDALGGLGGLRLLPQIAPCSASSLSYNRFLLKSGG